MNLFNRKLVPTAIPSSESLAIVNNKVVVKRPKLLLLAFLVAANVVLVHNNQAQAVVQQPSKYSPKEVAEETLADRIERYVSKVNPKLDRKAVREIAVSVVEYSGEAGLDPISTLAIIKIESSFKPNEISSAGAMGLMQLIPKHHLGTILLAAQKFGPNTNLFTPKVNIYLGLNTIKTYIAQHKTLEKALLQYNGSLNDKDKTYYKDFLAAKNEVARQVRQT